ncbi:MFS_1 domain-containing protein [Rhizoctonia solani AG-1 IA]|uniref:MFS_1 domain-containing protein n=1 Tax=Thanatephorus cucumeris (strain AG1-IA) TaxID=983506 RepID=L8WX03_THACA|nr:MFS_1 domain-containing protein [Rhizoctonia solani AG-1 IA]
MVAMRAETHGHVPGHPSCQRQPGLVVAITRRHPEGYSFIHVHDMIRILEGLEMAHMPMMPQRIPDSGLCPLPCRIHKLARCAALVTDLLILPLFQHGVGGCQRQEIKRALPSYYTRGHRSRRLIFVGGLSSPRGVSIIQKTLVRTSWHTPPMSIAEHRHLTPVASQEFGVSLERVNWLGNSVNLIYLPASMIVPLGFSRLGLLHHWFNWTVDICVDSLCWDHKKPFPRWQICSAANRTGFSQPWFQILGPKYSETWFDLRGRTTSTMIISIANPVGAALSQLIAPAFSTVRESVLILAIITSAAAPTAILIASKPPTPPTYAGSHPSPPAAQIFRAFIGKARQGDAFMSFRERIDMAIVTLLFGSFVAAFSAFSILINQIFAPYGYSSDAAGIMGGVLILAGIVGAVILSPIFDRYLTHHLALASKVLVPLLAASYIALIWDVRVNNYAGLYVVMVVIGVASFTLLPIALEIGCEVTRSAETSSAALWFTGNLLSVVFVLSMNALKDDSPDANPPSNMFKSLIFQACFVAVVAVSVFGLKGQQTRRELDVQKQQARQEGEPHGKIGVPPRGLDSRCLRITSELATWNSRFRFAIYWHIKMDWEEPSTTECRELLKAIASEPKSGAFQRLPFEELIHPAY